MPLWYTHKCQEANTYGVDLRTSRTNRPPNPRIPYTTTPTHPTSPPTTYRNKQTLGHTILLGIKNEAKSTLSFDQRYQVRESKQGDYMTRYSRIDCLLYN